MIRAILLAVFLAAPLQAKVFRVEREAPLPIGKDGKPMTGAPARLKSDGALRESAYKMNEQGLTAAGEWVVRSVAFEKPITVREANIFGKTAVEHLLEAPDRANIAVAIPGSTMKMIQSESLGFAVFFKDGKGFVGLADLKALPAHGTPAFDKVIAKIWEQRPSRAPPLPKTLPRYEGNYKIGKDVFSTMTAEDRWLATRARQVNPKKQHELRMDGFLPIDEVPGGTPYYRSDIDGWVRPFEEGTKTFP